MTTETKTTTVPCAHCGKEIAISTRICNRAVTRIGKLNTGVRFESKRDRVAFVLKNTFCSATCGKEEKKEEGTAP